MLGLTVSHAAATSAIAIVGREIGMLDDLAVTAAILAIFVTGFCGAFATDRAGKVLRNRAMLQTSSYQARFKDGLRHEKCR